MSIIPDMKFKHQSVNLGAARLDLTVRNLAVNGDWIEGDLEVKAEAIGQRLDETFHFKTKNNVEERFPLALGAEIRVKAVLENPRRVCIEGMLLWGPIKLPGRECVDI
jgi:hypothetical protein